MDTENKGYYEDIDVEVWSMTPENSTLQEVFYFKDLKNRRLTLNDDIDQSTVHEIVRHILQYNRDDMNLRVEDRKPIILYVCSNGGEMDSGFELIDVIKNSLTPVYTVNLGYQYSMGFLIGLAGHKRFATKNAKYLIHDGSSFIYGSSTKVEDQVEFNKSVNYRVKEYILANSTMKEEDYDKNLRREWYMFAQEAKSMGLTDYIIGEDCTLNDVL
jgi:ATP-dependent Clp protease protease subunit